MIRFPYPGEGVVILMVMLMFPSVRKVAPSTIHSNFFHILLANYEDKDWIEKADLEEEIEYVELIGNCALG